MRVIHIDSGTVYDVIRDDTYGGGFGIIEIEDPETKERHVMGGYEFQM